MKNMKTVIIIVLLILAFIILAMYNGWMVYEGFVAMNPDVFDLPKDMDTEYDIPVDPDTHKPDITKIPLPTENTLFPYKPSPTNATKYKRAVPSNLYRLNDTQYATLPNGDNIVPAPLNLDGTVHLDRIPIGYYVVDYQDKSTTPPTTKKMIAKVPYGSASYDKLTLTRLTQKEIYSQASTSDDQPIDISGSIITRYDLDNLDVTYHDSPENIAKTDVFSDISYGMMKIMGPDGVLIDYPFVGNTALPTYYQPGSFQLGASTYVPNYESSVYLSRLTNDGTIGHMYNKEGKAYESASSKAGFCNTYDIDKQGVEEKCGALDVNACASTSCCVLLGGSKCVAGNASGPAMRANYSDPFIMNKDFYYYSGKCYGNCT